AETLPLRPGSRTWTGFEREGHPVASAERLPTVAFNNVTPGYFRAMRIPLRAGRDFSPRDSAHAEPVAIIGESVRRTFFGADDPIGARIRLNHDNREPWLRVVGVFGDVPLE